MSKKENALKLRKAGLSYNQISKTLKIAKSTLSTWLSRIELDEIAKQKIQSRSNYSIKKLIERNRKQTLTAQEKSRNIRQISAQKIKRLSREDILIAGTCLYWAEGYKYPITRNKRTVTYHPVVLTNSDPTLIKLFLRFLREYCGVSEEKLRISLRIFPHQKQKILELFWSKVTHIPISQFQKTQTVISSSSKGQRPFQRLPYGIVQIRIADTRLFHTIMGYIDGMRNLI